MSRVLVVVAVLISSSCLTTVDQRWCDTQTPCSPGFVCTSTFHCIPAPTTVRDAGTTGGGVGGGGGNVSGGSGGGGGARSCEETCSGCCINDRCLTTAQQSEFACGVGGLRCRACAGAEICSAERGCVARSTPDAGTGVVGNACQSDMACGSDGLGICIHESSGEWPGGYCTRECGSSPCPTGAECIEADQGGGASLFICLATCINDGQCRSGYDCVPFNATAFCLPN